MESKRKNREKRRRSTLLEASAGPDAIYKCKCVDFRGEKQIRTSRKGNETLCR